MSNKKKSSRDFDFSRFHQRHIALLVCYIGHEYCGNAYQPENKNTVEHVLFEALKKVKLCEFDGDAPKGFSRCGRTDKGVSAFGNVVAVHVRSALKSGVDFVQRGANVSDEGGASEEYNYPHMLNRVLPPTIRVRAWSPVKADFSARFSCHSRTYRYFFPTLGLDVARMRLGAERLLGEHDFRNFCKMDVANVSNFVRSVMRFEITVMADACLACAEIEGTAFLYHQVRCMMSVLFMVGRGDEAPDIVTRLLDLRQTPKKPPYELAEENNLCLWFCAFKADQPVSWQLSDDEQVRVAQSFADLLFPLNCKTAMLRAMCDVHSLSSRAVRGPHIPLVERPPELDFDERIARLDARRKRRKDDEDEDKH
eukprot:PhM_4_TR7652/c0_g1_i1/m.102706/K01855/PUS3, DEG1; tRNA pseudouridine38/39 synthase